LLPSQHRIKSGSDFKLIMRSGRRVNSPAMTVYTHPNQEGLTRFGFVISKAVGNSVTRNLLKRRLRAAAKSRVREGLSLDVVIRANPVAAAVAFSALSETLAQALRDSSRG
jgi:ribonuclease P protein component